MSLLEDKILKRNVPGRWSSLDNDRNSDRGASSDDEVKPTKPYDEADLIQEASDLTNAEIPETIRQKILGQRIGKANTGVKGVLADYHEHKMLEDAQRDANAAYREAVLRRMAEGSRVTNHELLESSVFTNLKKGNGSDDDEEAEDDDDDEFMLEYRKKRLNEIKTVATLPVFGYCKDVDTSSFVDEVEKVDPRVIVIVHLFESSVQSCVRVNRYLEEIAHTHDNFKYLRMQASTNMITVDIVTLPILTFYRGGETFLTLAGLTQDLGEFFTKDDLEWYIDNALQSELIS